MKKMRLVMVTWEDVAVEEGTWIPTENPPEVPIRIFYQVGWLFSLSPRWVILTTAIEEDGKGYMAARERIPRGMVQAITELQPIPKRGRK